MLDSAILERPEPSPENEPAVRRYATVTEPPPTTKLDPPTLNELSVKVPVVPTRPYCKVRLPAVVKAIRRKIEELGAVLIRPRDVGLALVASSHHPDNMSGVRQDFDLTGRSAVEMLVSKLQQGSYGFPVAPKVICLDGEWVDGNTLLHSRR